MNHDSPPLSCDVWIFHHGRNSVRNGLPTNVLSDDENSRAAAYRDAGRRSSFIASRVGIREILADYLHVEPASVLLSRLPSGRPIVTHPSRPCRLPISISHTAQTVCLAVASSGTCVGVDIEHPDNLTYPQIFFDTVLAAQERQLFDGLNVAAQRQLMLEMWTIKEATFKAIACKDQPTMKDIVVGGRPNALRLLSAPGLHAEPQLVQFQAVEPTCCVEQNESRADVLSGSLVVDAVHPQEALESLADANSFARVRENRDSIVDRMARFGLQCRLEEFSFGAARSLATTGSSAGGS